MRHERVHQRPVALRIRGRSEWPAHLGVHRLDALYAALVLRAGVPARRRSLRARRRRVRHRVRVHAPVAGSRRDFTHARDERPGPIRPSPALARLYRDVVRHLRRLRRVVRAVFHLA